MTTTKTHIDKPFWDDEQLALLEAGFPVQPNVEIQMSEATRKVIRNCVEMMLDIQAKSGTVEAVDAVLEMSSLENSKKAKASHSNPLEKEENDSVGQYGTKEIKEDSNKPKELSAVESKFNERFNSYETAPF